MFVILTPTLDFQNQVQIKAWTNVKREWFSFFNGPNPASFCLFLYFHMTNLTVNNRRIDGVLGTRTRGGRMVGADKSTELLRHTWNLLFCNMSKKYLTECKIKAQIVSFIINLNQNRDCAFYLLIYLLFSLIVVWASNDPTTLLFRGNGANHRATSKFCFL